MHKKIAIYRTSAIGDMILATSALSYLRQVEIPENDITWIGAEPALSLISRAYPEMQTIDIAEYCGFFKKFQLVRRLAQLDLIVNYQKNLRSHFLCALLFVLHGVKTVSYSKRQLFRWRLLFKARLRSRNIKSSGVQENPNIIWQYQMNLKPLQRYFKNILPDGERVINARPDLRPFRGPADQEEFSSWLPKCTRFMVLAPGATHVSKMAPGELLLQIFRVILVDYLAQADNKPLSCVVLGSESEKEYNIKLLEDFRNNFGEHLDLVDYTGQLPLAASAYIISRSTVLLTNDSSLVHIAEALDVPVAALFGPTVEAFGFAPWQGMSKAFSVPLSCRPCSKHGKLACRFDDKLCFSMISTAAVGSFIARMLSSSIVDAR